MKLALFGTGKMGELVEKLAMQNGHTIVAKISSNKRDLESIRNADLCIDFSTPNAVMKNLEIAAKYKKNLVIGTTGWYESLEKAKEITEKNGIGVVYGPNFSVGMGRFFQIVEEASRILNEKYETALVEMHHKYKKDAPSGTAKALAAIVKGECPISSVRAGSMPGTHTLFFNSSEDQITLTHEARSRQGFAEGALLAAEWVYGKKGFYHFNEVLK